MGVYGGRCSPKPIENHCWGPMTNGATSKFQRDLMGFNGFSWDLMDVSPYLGLKMGD